MENNENPPAILRLCRGGRKKPKGKILIIFLFEI